MTSSMLRRQLKNLVQNYSEAEVKVREATSNDPWGPSSSQMADISDLTYNAIACSEIMTMLWKRLKDDKNWRHIHKSLTLLEYLLKTGDDRVLLKMKENIYIVKALTEYRFVEKDGKDQGVNVREKAKVVLVLMEDDEKLKAEREFAFKTREKTSKGAAASSADNVKDPGYKPVYVPGATGLPSLDNIPSVADLTASFAARKEERLRQEAEKKEVDRRAKLSEDELAWEDAGKSNDAKSDAWGGEKEEEKEEVKKDPWGAPKKPSSDPWGAPAKTEEDQIETGETDEDPFAAPKDKPDPFSPLKAKGMASAPLDRSGAFADPLAQNHDPFSPSLTPAHGAIPPIFGAVETAQLKEPLWAVGAPLSAHCVFRAAQVAPETGKVPPTFVIGNPQREMGMMPLGYPAEDPLGTADVSSSSDSAGLNPFIGYSPHTEEEGFLDESINIGDNPFLL
uniref:ENTH domain-containing protein n=1 Tax=Nothobranchius kuhntae TaxID=321403 RepID=A0A1A8I2Z2_NOTKU